MKTVIILLLVIFCLGEGLASRSNYGDTCNKTQKCDSRAWLACYDGVCDCAKEDTMTYELETGKCVSKSGELCKFGVEDNEESSFFQMANCVQNAKCGSDGFCVCESKYHETYNGTCALSNLLGEECTDIEPCSKYAALKCTNGTCQCNTEVSEYLGFMGACIGLPTKSCVDGNCVLGAVCKNNTCICDSIHFYDNKTNSCQFKKRVFMKCLSDEECRQTDLLKLVCIEGKCNCENKSLYSRVRKSDSDSHYYGNRYYGESVDTCAPIVGQLCPEGYCISGSTCTNYNRGYNSEKVCTCHSDLYPNKNYTKCAKIAGDSCLTEQDCIDGLQCQNEKCACPSPAYQTFDDTLRVCQSNVGTRCNKDTVCVKDAFCKITEIFDNQNISGNVGHCTCKKGFVVDGNQRCSVGYGQRCLKGECDSAASLKCTNNICSCPDEMSEYSHEFRNCRGLVGARCNVRYSGGLESTVYFIASMIANKVNLETYSTKILCVENAECHVYNSMITGICRCKEGFVENLYSKCESPIAGINNTSPRVISI